MPQRFEEEEAQAILREAMHPTEPGLDLDEIVRTGAELGIPEARVREAAERVRAERRMGAIAAEYRRTERMGFLAHLVPYLAVNAGLLMAAVKTGSGYPLIGTLFGWGIGLAFHAHGVFDERSAEWRKGLRAYAEGQAAEGKAAETAPIP